MSEFGELKFKEEIVKKVMEKHKSKKTFAELCKSWVYGQRKES